MPLRYYENSVQVARSRMQVVSSFSIHSTPTAAVSNTVFMQSALLVKILCQGEFPCSRLQNAAPTPLHLK